MWLIARRVCVLFHDSGNSSIRIGSADDGDGAATAPARNTSAVKTRFRTGRAHKIHDQIRPAGAQTARRVTRVRLVHKLAETPKLRLMPRTQQHIAKFPDAPVLKNWMRRGPADFIHAFGIDFSHRIYRSVITAEKFGA